MKINKDKKQSGQIIMFVVFIVLFLMLFVSLFVTRTLIKQAKVADNIVNSVQAFYVADSGAEYALYRFKNFCPTGYDPATCIGTFNSFGSNTCVITVDADSTINVVGTFNSQTSRAIQLSWVSG